MIHQQKFRKKYKKTQLSHQTTPLTNIKDESFVERLFSAKEYQNL